MPLNRSLEILISELLVSGETSTEDYVFLRIYIEHVVVDIIRRGVHYQGEPRHLEHWRVRLRENLVRRQGRLDQHLYLVKQA